MVRLRCGDRGNSSDSRRCARARAWSIALLTTIRCSQGPNGRRRSKRSSARIGPGRFLCDVLGRGTVPHDEVGGAVRARPVRPEETLERLARPTLRLRADGVRRCIQYRRSRRSRCALRARPGVRVVLVRCSERSLQRRLTEPWHAAFLFSGKACEGRSVAACLRDVQRRHGGSFATIADDGSIHAKVGWWREGPGNVQITIRRYDGTGPITRTPGPDGYGKTGFQPSILTFATTGCWRITGKVGPSQISFVVRVSKVGA